MKPNERLQAVNILSSLLDKQIPLMHLLQSTPDLSPFVKALSFGVCRHYFRLQILADKLLDKRPKSTPVWTAILIGLYQLHYLDIPDYAVVKETVELLPSINSTWAKGLVNAVLRRYCREKETIIISIQKAIAYRYGHPSWFIKRLKADWPLEWETICQANDERALMTLRVNHRMTSVSDYIKTLAEVGIEATPLAFSKDGLVLRTPCDVHDLPEFSNGFVSVQDEAPQLAVQLLNLQPGQRVLDACCAPGGKTCHILEREENLKECVAIDIDNYRMQRVTENLSRLNLKATTIVGDALITETWWDGEPFDRILLDAPCSATGVIRRHPDIKLLRTPDEIETITHMQHALLRKLWPLLKSGGLMVYATCSIMPEENDQQIAEFLNHHPDCAYQPPDAGQAWGHSLPHGIQILPGEHQMDGFFYSVLKKL